MKEIPYNVVDHGITNALVDLEVTQDMDYFILWDAPTNANVTVKLNSKTAKPIKLKVNNGFMAKNVSKIYVSADSVAGETIQIVQSDDVDGFELITSPTLDAIDTITTLNDIGASATNLDKIINPYNEPTYTEGSSSAAADTLVLNETLTCDKIIIDVLTKYNVTTAGVSNHSAIVAFLDDVAVAYSYMSSSGAEVSSKHNFIGENVSGKVLKIYIHNYSTQHTGYYTIQKFTKKT